MRRLPVLVSLSCAIVLSLAAGPALGQPAETQPALPRALEPDGHLPLQGTPWRLEEYVLHGVERAPGPEVAAWMVLGPDDVDASGGCSPIKGHYGVTGGAIAFRLPRPRGTRACAEQTMMVQLGMSEGLREASTYEFVLGDVTADDKLVFRGPNGEASLRFGLDDIDGLAHAEWRLLSYTSAGRSVGASSQQPAVLSFRPRKERAVSRTASGPVSGSTGCNGVVAQFYRHADAISFGPLDLTDAPCSPELAAQEEAMVAVLDATSATLALPPDRLILTASETGDRLEFMSQRPLEGTTWLLRPKGGSFAVEEPVTMYLSDGQATGEGPCGPYTASYVTDGLFITFDVPADSGDEGCGDLAERTLFSGLRSTVRLVRDEQLRLIDAAGRVALRFTSPSTP